LGWLRAKSAVRKQVCDTAEAAGKILAVDLFALESNNKCQRFHSFHYTHGTEGADAFDRLSWSYSECPCGQRHLENVYAFPPMNLLLLTWICLQKDRVAGNAIVPMSPGAPWWPIMTSGQNSKLQTFAGTILTMPEKCAKINANSKLCPQATAPRMPPTVLSDSAIEIAARRNILQALSTPLVRALNQVVQQDLNLERSVASQDW